MTRPRLDHAAGLANTRVQRALDARRAALDAIDAAQTTLALIMRRRAAVVPWERSRGVALAAEAQACRADLADWRKRLRDAEAEIKRAERAAARLNHEVALRAPPTLQDDDR